jgi:choline dehydrogenase-like flavoprotein
MTETEFDLIIVGSGAAGSLFAASATAAGKKVLILESGPARGLQDLTSSQIHARHLKWSAEAVEEEGNLKVGNNFNCGWGTGGSAMHHYAVWPRMHSNDFKTQSQYGIGVDWPIEYSDLQPYYDRIQLEVGLSGDAKAEVWRPEGAPYPQGPLPVFAQGQTIAKGFKALGKTVAPIPMAINSSGFDKRPACLFDGWCDAGCPTGALFNPQVKYLPEALKKNGELRNNAVVSRLFCDNTGKRVAGVEYIDRNNGNTYKVRGKAVVLAAFALQNPRLLLNSASDKHPQGLANGSGAVGHYLMTHPARSIYGLFQEDTTPHLGPTGGQLICHDAYADKTAIEGAYGSYQWLIANAMKPNDLLGFGNTRPDLIGDALTDFMQRAAKHIGTMVYVGEDIARRENRVELSSNKDQFGLPLARAIHNTVAKTDKQSEHAKEEGLAIFKAAGSTESWTGPAFGMHIMGGTIMGSNPEHSVCNAWGQSHDIDNLFIAGTGLFPSSAAVNPTFTLHALAEMSSEYLLKNWSSITR